MAGRIANNDAAQKLRGSKRGAVRFRKQPRPEWVHELVTRTINGQRVECKLYRYPLVPATP